ncbi:MAG: histidine kinase [Ignavibacteriales bacterium]|nr:histidine kinase [Ignavibacteriales bacterium]
MRYRIRDVLLVSSLYDLYLFEEDGRLYELIQNEYQGLSLSHAPELTRVSSGTEALSLAGGDKKFDLIITTLHIDDMTAFRLATLVKESKLGIPIVLLANDNKELSDFLSHEDTSVFDEVFLWQGDFRLIIGMIEHIEDKINVERDTKTIGVQSIILIEDNVRYYSSFLPIIYTEVLKQSQRLISEGINISHKFLRMRARPKILLCQKYEEAWEYFEKYKEHILGIISDIDFPKRDKPDQHAGLTFARDVKAQVADIPILLQSTTPEYEEQAHAIGCSFLLKDSPTLLHELRQFMTQYFSFGDFVFRMPNGREVGRATDLKSLEDQLRVVPDATIKYHAERNHFSNWLKARTEFWVAHQLRPRKVSDYPSITGLREDLISHLREYRRSRQRGLITDFTRETFDPDASFARIGGGSLGGKARGLGFVNALISTYDIEEQFEGVHVHVPPAAVVGTDVFDEFLDENNLRHFALNASNDHEVTKRFLEVRRFPTEILSKLREYLELVTDPLAVRSSSLLEDSQYHPFAGVYETHMIPNNDSDLEVRLAQLVNAIKRVYASTFCQSAKSYIKFTSFRLEEEKMAVIIQRMVGTAHGERFYPDFSGVAKSHNFYPVAPETAEDGIVSVALGLGKIVVEGGNSVRFCPRYPTHLLNFFSPEQALKNNQNTFFALDLKARLTEEISSAEGLLKRFDLKNAEQDESLQYVGSTYSQENDAIYDGLSRKGLRVVSFAPILRGKIFPLPQILESLLEAGTVGMGTPVEIEFAVRMSVADGSPREFGVLQMRPVALSYESEQLATEELKHESLICYSEQVLGHGVLSDLYDIVLVDVDRFERSKSQEVAQEVMHMNRKLVDEGRPYVLIGVGRWGSLDPWLGIPVKWDQISGARAIIETGFKDMDVTPSQGSHFFQNITSFMVGYFTVSSLTNHGFVDWKWLAEQVPAEELTYVRHLRFQAPVVVKMNSHLNKGVILKPEK